MRFLLGFAFSFSVAFASPVYPPSNRYNLRDWEQFENDQGFPPFISELAYRALADHVIDPNHLEFDPDHVQSGDIVYCGVWFLDWFCEQVHDQIKNPYILLTCDLSSWIPRLEHLKLVYDPKLVCWFAKNMLFADHPKFLPLPMGQIYYLWASLVPPELPVFRELVAHHPAKEILLYMNHTEREHGRRMEVAEKFSKVPYCYSRNNPRRQSSFSEYWNETARSKFVISPLGLEVDCTRTWECFALGAIPIVEHSYLDPVYEKLPILLIHRWGEITEDFLNQKYQEFQNQSFELERAFIPYWANLMHQKKTQIQRGELPAAFLESTRFTESELNEINEILKNNDRLQSPLLYQAVLSCMRPFQLAKALPSIPEMQLFDMWTIGKGMDYIRTFTKDPALCEGTKVVVKNPNELNDALLEEDITVFLDLTHFRHKILTGVSQLDDFCHSLKKDIFSLYRRLPFGSFLMGTGATVPYIEEVLQQINTTTDISIQIQGKFWFCPK